MFNDSLRQAKSGTQLAWTKAELLAGLEYYKELNGRFPTAYEIDAFPYLPASRSIQRSYGGLEKLRQELFPTDIANYTKGAHRSAIASKTFNQGRDYERKMYEYLITQFAEIAVHEHKVIRPGQVNCDFYIYLSENIGVVIDVFYANSMLNLINVVNIKLKRYVLIEPETYLVVVGNPAITTDLLQIKIKNKRNTLPSHISVITEEEFKNAIVPALKLRSVYAYLDDADIRQK